MANAVRVWTGAEWQDLALTGPQGPIGPQGGTGATGPQGPTGATGSQGPQGATGTTGATGPQGPAGLGMNIKGTVATFSALPVQPQPANDAYTTTDSGHMWVSNGTAWVDAGLIQGPQGPTGATGPQGPTGATGAQGSTGAAGAASTVPGPTGPQGVAGPTGSAGAQGPKGDTGATGAASTVPGPQGSQGIQGPQGTTGATGASGSQGPQGDPGATGSTGPAGPGVATGGTTGQVLTKTSATDYTTNWQTPLALPLGQPLTFNPDNTYDVGAVATTRPRTGYFGTSLVTPFIALGATPSSAGGVRLGNTQTIGWRNAGNTADYTLSVNASNNLSTTTHVVPAANGTLDLGLTAARWRKLWAVDGEFTNVPTVGGVSLDTRYSASPLPANSVGASQITDGTVGTVELADGAVTSLKIADGTIAAGDMAAGAAATNVGTLGGVLGGTLPNPTLAANSVGASQITDGTVGTAELANAAVTNAKLASDTARDNLLTNGGFEIWQRGNGPFTVSGYSVDRWCSGILGTDTLSISKNTANADTANGSVSCAACTFVLGTGAGTTLVYQGIMAADGYQTLNRQMTFSCRVRVSTASAVRLGGYTGSAWTYGSYHTGDGTYQTLTVTWTPTTSGNHSAGVFFSATCTAYLDNAMLVVGSVAADYAPLHPADDLARCLRYYEIVGEGTVSIAHAAYGGTSANVQTPMSLKVRKAVSPTQTVVGAWVVVNCGQPIFGGGGVEVFFLQSQVTSLGMMQWYNGNAGNKLTFEANP